MTFEKCFIKYLRKILKKKLKEKNHYTYVMNGWTNLEDYFLVANPVVTMLLVGVLPIVIEAGIALLLAKKNIIIKI